MNEEEQVFVGHGIAILNRQGRLFVQYDAGGIATRWVEAEISDEEARKAQQSERAAYEVLLKVQAREQR